MFTAYISVTSFGLCLISGVYIAVVKVSLVIGLYKVSRRVGDSPSSPAGGSRSGFPNTVFSSCSEYQRIDKI
jgi:hypothetical protein